MKQLTQIWIALDKVRHSKSGVALVEFTILFPLLMLLFAASVEISRMYISYRALEHATEGLGRHYASLPEYDKRARDQALPIARSLLPGKTTADFNLQVTALERDGAGFNQVFSHTAFGTNPNVAWSGVVKPGNYEQSERVIFLAGTYKYKPMFGILPLGTITLKKFYVATPFFSRKYVYNTNTAVDKYVY